MNRRVARIVTAHQQSEGAGFLVRRPFPTEGLAMVDPFLLLDEMGPVEYQPGEAVGAPDHPHRGFETVSYLLEGELHHEDSTGHKGVLRAGDVQWMTAGRGVVHSETPTASHVEHGGRAHGFQLWVNLPARDKMMEPRYQEVPAAQLPEGQCANGLVKAKVIAGEALGVRSVIDTRTPILFQDWQLEPGGRVEQNVPAGWNAFAYVFAGEARIGDEESRVASGQLGLLTDGDRVRLSVPPDAKRFARLLLVGGVSIDEPVARHGPFVMNTQQEIRQAIEDLQRGRFGGINRT